MQRLGSTPPRLPSGWSDRVQLQLSDRLKLQRAALNCVDGTAFVAQTLGSETEGQRAPSLRRCGSAMGHPPHLSAVPW